MLSEFSKKRTTELHRWFGWIALQLARAGKNFARKRCTRRQLWYHHQTRQCCGCPYCISMWKVSCKNHKSINNQEYCFRNDLCKFLTWKFRKPLSIWRFLVLLVHFTCKHSRNSKMVMAIHGIMTLRTGHTMQYCMQSLNCTVYPLLQLLLAILHTMWQE